MSLAQGLSLYLTLNLLIALAAGGLGLVTLFAKNLSRSSLLKLHYQGLLLALGISAFAPLLPAPTPFEPVAKVWSGTSWRNPYSSTASPRPATLSLGSKPASPSLPTDAVSWVALGLLSLCLLVALARLAGNFQALTRIRRGAYPLRCIGRVEILVHDQIAIPFSFRTLTAQVVMPASLLAKPEAFRLALKHELQHHRQGDTLWAYPLLALNALCVPNPAFHWWRKHLHEIQEFACDEAVLGQRKVNSQAYARCLLEVAEQAFHQERIPACATGFSIRVERNLIKRRIERMMHSTRKTKWNTIPLCAALALVLGASAFAAKSLVQDRRVSFAQAKEMATVAAKSSEFPVTVNELVVAELNRYIGTPEGRNFIRASLARMENHRPMIEAKLSEYDMPAELLAVPLIESGYQNLEETNKHGWGAGLWMFIKSTARNYGLRVDDRVDERLNTELLTDAAMRYWRANFLRFRDWQLAGLAYNMGENAVQKAINETGSRDAFTLVRKGYEGDKNYLARLMAAILILKNPETLK